MNVSVDYIDKPKPDYAILESRLVRGVSSRAIEVHVWIPNHIHDYDYDWDWSDEQFIDAAKQASKKGWKRIYIQPDDYLGETLMASREYSASICYKGSGAFSFYPYIKHESFECDFNDYYGSW